MASAILSVNGGFLSAAECSPKNCIELDTAKKEYRRYIQLFVEIIWVITLVNPLLAVLGKNGDLFEKISYDSFWQGLESIKMDREKLDFLDEGYYVKYGVANGTFSLIHHSQTSKADLDLIHCSIGEATELKVLNISVLGDNYEFE